MLGFTIKAICESWGIDEKEVIQESMIDLVKRKPIVDTYTNAFEGSRPYSGFILERRKPKEGYKGNPQAGTTCKAITNTF
ncbi:MAG: hypothetical protein ACI9J3_001930, partial [Parvicellaceae bacterium]